MRTIISGRNLDVTDALRIPYNLSWESWTDFSQGIGGTGYIISRKK